MSSSPSTFDSDIGISSFERRLLIIDSEFEKYNQEMNQIITRETTASFISSESNAAYRNYVSERSKFDIAKSAYESERPKIGLFLEGLKKSVSKLLPVLVEFNNLFKKFEEQIQLPKKNLESQFLSIDKLVNELKSTKNSYDGQKKALIEATSNINSIAAGAMRSLTDNASAITNAIDQSKLKSLKDQISAKARAAKENVDAAKYSEYDKHFSKEAIDDLFEELIKSRSDSTTMATMIETKLRKITEQAQAVSSALPELIVAHEPNKGELSLSMDELLKAFELVKSIRLEFSQYDDLMKSVQISTKGSNQLQPYIDYANNSLTTLSNNAKTMSLALKSMAGSQAFLKAEELRKGFERRTNLFETMHKKHELYSENALMGIVALTVMTLIVLAALMIFKSNVDSLKNIETPALAIYISTRVSFALVVAWTVSFLVRIRATNQRQAILYKDRALGLSILEELITKFKDSGKADILFDKIMIGYLEFQRSGFDTEEGKGSPSDMISTVKQFGDTIVSLMPVIQALRAIAPNSISVSDTAGSTMPPLTAGTKTPASAAKKTDS